MERTIRSPLDELRSELIRVNAMVAFGLQAAATASVDALHVPETFGGFGGPMPGVSIDDTRRAFKTWVLASGLQECTNALAPALLSVSQHCYVATRPSTVMQPQEDGRVTMEYRLESAGMVDEINKAVKDFDRAPLPHRFDRLEREFGWGRPPSTDHIVSLYVARNCLVHRLGRVGKVDLTEGLPGLRMRWKAFEVRAEREGVTHQVEAGFTVQTGDLVSAVVVDRERLIPRGERVDITAQEFVDMAFTFLMFGTELEESVRSVFEREVARRGQG